MTPPIVGVDLGDVVVFDSVHVAECYIEIDDVWNKTYRLFDSEGRLLEAFVVCDRPTFFGGHSYEIKVREAEPQRACAEELKSVLADFLQRIRQMEDLAPLNLRDLVKLAHAVARTT